MVLCYLRTSCFRTSLHYLHALTVVILLLSVSPAATTSPTPLTDVVQVGADDAKKLRKQAERLVRQGRMAEAEAMFRRSIALDPSNSETKLKLAFTLHKQRRIVEAYEIGIEVAKAEPKNAQAFAVIGNALLSGGRFDEARNVLFAAIQLDRREAAAWAGFGLLDFYNNRIGESLANLREAVFHAPEHPDYIFSLAQVSARAERFRESAEAYEQFLRVSRNTDDERRSRIKGLINFLRYLDKRGSLYTSAGGERSKVPFELASNRPVIEVKINDNEKPLRFVLDTGSGITVISQETAARLKLSPITRGGFAKAIGGDGQFEIVYGFLRSFAIGDIKLRSVPVYIRKFHNNSLEIDGYIGLSVLSKFLTTVDYGERTFTLVSRTTDVALPEKGVTVPLRLTTSGFLSGEVQLEGVDLPLNFIVDTGASISVISDQLATNETVNSFLRTERMRVIGAAGITENVPTYLLPKVSFGSHSSTGITAISLDLDMINEVSGFEQAGILGGNFLRNYRMTFDFKNSNVTFSPIELQP